MRLRKKNHEELIQKREAQNRNYRLLMQKFQDYESKGIGYYGSKTENKLAFHQTVEQTVSLAPQECP